MKTTTIESHTSSMNIMAIAQFSEISQVSFVFQHQTASEKKCLKERIGFTFQIIKSANKLAWKKTKINQFNEKNTAGRALQRMHRHVVPHGLTKRQKKHLNWNNLTDA